MKRSRLLAALVAGVLLLAACGNDDDDTDAADLNGTDTPEAAADDDAGATPDDEAPDDEAPTDEAPTEATVAVATHDDLGEHLVDADGRTLYLFALDDGTTTACSGPCADAWPPLVDAAPSGGDGVDAGALGTADGIEADQVTYHGNLLYYFASDENPGEISGTQVPEWFAVNPAGEPIELDG